jgi:hypothetical protein
VLDKGILGTRHWGKHIICFIIFNFLEKPWRVCKLSERATVLWKPIEDRRLLSQKQKTFITHHKHICQSFNLFASVSWAPVSIGAMQVYAYIDSGIPYGRGTQSLENEPLHSSLQKAALWPRRTHHLLPPSLLPLNRTVKNGMDRVVRTLHSWHTQNERTMVKWCPQFCYHRFVDGNWGLEKWGNLSEVPHLIKWYSKDLYLDTLNLEF